MKKPVIIVAAFILLSLLWAFAKTDNTPTPQTIAETPKTMTDDEKRQAENDRKIAEAQAEFSKSKSLADAMRPFDEQHYPKMYAKYGNEAMQRVNALLPEIGNKVANSKYCDKVEMSGISDQSTPNNMVVYVNCANLKQYHVSENDLKNNIEIIPSN